MRKLFLDDVRTVEMVYKLPFSEGFYYVKSYVEFVAYIQKHGLPDFISFDNDLRLNEFGEIAPDGYAAAKWLVYSSSLDLSNLNYKVHSANPVASIQIRSLLENYKRFLKEG
jgi:hypothetical protein